VEHAHGSAPFVDADKDGGRSGEEGGDRAEGDLERAYCATSGRRREILEFGGSPWRRRGKNGEMGGSAGN